MKLRNTLELQEGHVHNNSNKSFKSKKYKKEYIWNLKKNYIQYKINWKIFKKKTNTDIRQSQICYLCLEKKYQNLKNDNILNSRNELISKCRH